MKPIVQERGHLNKSEAKSVERSIYMYIEKRDVIRKRKRPAFIGMRSRKGQ